jgi:exodeoxyribonuclease V alpha subunit
VKALNATGLLATFNDAQVLDVADVHIARSLCRLAEESSDVAALATALTVRALRHGSMVLELDRVAEIVSDDETVGSAGLPWPELAELDAALTDSALLGGPLRREGNRVWLEACWQQEVLVADELLLRSSAAVVFDRTALRDALARLWPSDEPDDQRLAAAVCALSRVAILGGGPGTGKTTTVARLFIALRESVGSQLVALAAPTGRAAARLGESLRRDDPVLTADDAEYLASLRASTLHRLLGIQSGRQAWHNRSNRLPFDVVVVDEASMVSRSMFATLLSALRMPG